MGGAFLDLRNIMASNYSELVAKHPNLQNARADSIVLHLLEKISILECKIEELKSQLNQPTKDVEHFVAGSSFVLKI